MTEPAPVSSSPDGRAPGQPAGRPDVELRLPAGSAYAAVVRTTTAGLAARLDFTIDDIEDLRIAVGEANALLLEHAEPGGDLICSFHLAPGTMVVALTVSTSAHAEPDLDSFAWQVLSTLAASAAIEATEDHLTVSMTMTSSVLPSSYDDL